MTSTTIPDDMLARIAGGKDVGRPWPLPCPDPRVPRIPIPHPPRWPRWPDVPAPDPIPMPFPEPGIPK